MKTFDFIGVIGGLLAGLGWIILFALSLQAPNKKPSDDPDRLDNHSSLVTLFCVFIAIATFGISEFVKTLNSNKSDKYPTTLGLSIFIAGVLLIAVSFIA